jgi:NTE family protein
MDKQKKIAIACQGGGSHTAFAAGVLTRLLEEGIDERYQLVGLSGTSGGAICATAAWYGLLKKAWGAREKPYHWLVKFWEENSAQLFWEQYLNMAIVWTARLQNHGIIPAVAIDPDYTQCLVSFLEAFLPRQEYLNLKRILEKNINFEELEQLVISSSPRLLLGAVEVLSGEFKTFDSDKKEITTAAIMASAGIPTIFQAIKIGHGVYWDGLFSQNPPISVFVEEANLEKRPDEIWIIQINPKTCYKKPTTAQAIIGRRDELTGNLSLLQEIKFINTINAIIEKGYLNPEYAGLFKKIDIRWISMDSRLASEIDYASKLDRSQQFITKLMEHGKSQANTFLQLLEQEPVLVSKATQS